MGMRRVNFTSIPVKDFGRALAFYRDIMGLTVTTDADYGADGRWIFLSVPGADTMLHFVAADQVQFAPGHPALYLICDDVDAELPRLREHAVSVHSGPDDAPWDPNVRWAMILDSEDNLILLQSSQSEGA